MKNRELMQVIEKADLALSDLTTDGGYLDPEVAKKFVENLVDEPTLLNAVDVHILDRQKQTVPHIGFGSRISHPGTMGTASDSDDRVKPTTSEVTLDGVHVKAVVHIPYDVLFFNVEKGQFADHVQKLARAQIALDIEELMLNGKIDSGDSFLALLDGLFAQATTNISDAAGAALSRTIFKNIAMELPSRFRKQMSDLRFIVSPNTQLEWLDQLAARGTTLGDTALASGKPVPAYGSPLLPASGVLDGLTRTIASASVTDLTDILYTHPKNILVGIYKEIMMETDRDIDAGIYKVVFRYYVDTKFGEEVGVAKGTNVKVS